MLLTRRAAVALLLLSPRLTRLDAQGATAEATATRSPRTAIPTPRSRDASIAGRVVAAGTGEPVAEVTVRVSASPAVEPRAATTDRDGRFSVGGLPPGPVRLEARRMGYRAVDTTIVAGDGDTTRVVLTLAPLVAALPQVVVTGQRAPQERTDFDQLATPGRVGLTSTAVAAVPAVGERDLFRAVQLLPGVVARNDFSAGLNVQGGETDQNLILLDGVPLYAPFHLGGLFGAFIDPAIARVDLQEAGFAAPYGGRLSSLLDVTSREEHEARVSGSVNVSVLATSVVAGRTFGAGRGSWTVAARRTYADVLARTLARRTLPYHFEDGQAHATYALSEYTRVAGTGYVGADLLDGPLSAFGDTGSTGASRLHLDFGNAAGGVSLTHVIPGIGHGLRGDSVVATQRVSATRFASHFHLGSGAFRFDNSITQQLATGALTRFGPELGGTRALRAGYELSRYQTALVLSTTQLDAGGSGGRPPLTALALFADDEWRPTSSVLVRPGVRYERVDAAHWAGVSPRLAVKVFVTPDVALTAAAGRYTQWVQTVRNDQSPVPIGEYWMTSGQGVPVNSARHLVMGAERWFGATRFARVEGYYKRYDHLNEPNPASYANVPGSAFLRATGSAYGASVFLRQLDVGRAAGWLSYGYGVAARTVRDPRLGLGTPVTYAPVQDQRHTLNVVATYRFGPGAVGTWTMATRLGFGSGTPYTPQVGRAEVRSYDPATGEWTPVEGQPVLGPQESDRLPATRHVDVSASRHTRWFWGHPTTLSIAVTNVTNSPNVFAYSYQFNAAPPTRRALGGFPILPSIGLSVAFGAEPTPEAP